MLQLALILTGSALAFVILAYTVHIIFFPLARTIGGGLQILRMYGLKKSGAAYLEKTQAFLTPDLELGLTMADGGEKTEKTEKEHEAVTEKTGIKN